MKLLFLGDVVGRAGRSAVIEGLPGLREELKLDFVVVNAENAAAGFGLTASIADQLFEAGADVLTLGDHAFDQKEMLTHLDKEKRIIRPLNIAKAAPGRGVGVFEATRGRRVLVAQALGRVFMKQPYDDPFSALDAALKTAPLGCGVDAVIVEIHAEATSEKTAMGYWLDGRASMIVGAHTHIPTSDTRILPKGAAYQSDAGMCGSYESVIGMSKEEPLRRFVTGLPGGRFEPAPGPGTLSGVFVETDDKTGKAVSVRPIRRGGVLSEA